MSGAASRANARVALVIGLLAGLLEAICDELFQRSFVWPEEAVDAGKIVQIIKQHSPTRSFKRAEWRLIRVVENLHPPSHCVCGKAIRNVVWIQLAKQSRKVLHLGTDCYAMLVKEWGGVPLDKSSAANQVLRAQHGANLRKRYERLPEVVLRGQAGPNCGGSWDHWLMADVSRRDRSPPTDVKAGVQQLLDFGFIGSAKLMDACVEYYNTHRRFDAHAILGRDFKKFGVESLTQLTIAEAIALLRAPSPSAALPPPATPGPTSVGHPKAIPQAQGLVRPVARRPLVESVKAVDLRVERAPTGKKPKVRVRCRWCRDPVVKSKLRGHENERCLKRPYLWTWTATGTDA
jgi:hypothetical protein